MPCKRCGGAVGQLTSRYCSACVEILHASGDVVRTIDVDAALRKKDKRIAELEAELEIFKGICTVSKIDETESKAKERDMLLRAAREMVKDGGCDDMTCTHEDCAWARLEAAVNKCGD